MRFGALDLLGTVGSSQSFESLRGETVQLPLAGYVVRILDLPALIRLKEALARDKDRAVLAILRRTLAERDAQQ